MSPAATQSNSSLLLAFAWSTLGAGWFARIEKFFALLARRKNAAVAFVGLSVNRSSPGNSSRPRNPFSVHPLRLQYSAAKRYVPARTADQSHAGNAERTSKPSTSRWFRAISRCTFPGRGLCFCCYITWRRLSARSMVSACRRCGTCGVGNRKANPSAWRWCDQSIQ